MTSDQTPDNDTAPAQGEAREDLVQLRFADDDGKVHDLNAAEMAEVLQGLVELTSQLYKSGAYGRGLPPEVRVRPAREGSFVLEALVQWTSENPEAALSMSLAAGAGATKLATDATKVVSSLGQGIQLGLKVLRGEQPKDIQMFDDGEHVKVTWPDDTAQLVPHATFKEFSKLKRQTRGALRKLMAPLSDDVQRLEVRDGAPSTTSEDLLAKPADIVVNRTDYRVAAAEVAEEETSTETFKVEAQLMSVDFEPGGKWRIRTPRGERKVTIEDDDFLKQLDKGLALHKSDLFDVTIREERTVKNSRTATRWEVIKVVRKARGDGNVSDEAPGAVEPPEAPSA